MEQKDFISKEIEKIRALFQYLIGKYCQSKTLQEKQNTEELINHELKEKYGKDLEAILKLNTIDFEFEFSFKKGFNFENIELLADLLFNLAIKQPATTKKYLTKARENNLNSLTQRVKPSRLKEAIK